MAGTNRRNTVSKGRKLPPPVLAHVVPARVVRDEDPGKVTGVRHHLHELHVAVDRLRADAVELDPGTTLGGPLQQPVVALVVRVHPDEGVARDVLRLQHVEFLMSGHAVTGV